MQQRLITDYSHESYFPKATSIETTVDELLSFYQLYYDEWGVVLMPSDSGRSQDATVPLLHNLKMVVSSDMMSHEEIRRLNELLDLFFTDKVMGVEKSKELEELINKSCESSGESQESFMQRKKEEFRKARDAEDQNNHEH